MPNDPMQQAQHNYLGKDWERFFQSLQGKRVNLGPVGLAAGGHRPGAGNLLPSPRDAYDSPRIDAANFQIDQEQDARRLGLIPDPRDVIDAELRALRGHQTTQRALAIANDPNTSVFGRPIAKREDGSYTTLRPNPNEPQPPVNRQAIAAQMAPGQIAPPPPPKPVTYGDPKPMMVNGKESPVRMGSDGQPYDMARRPIDPATIQLKPDKAAVDRLSGLPTPYRSAIDRILVTAAASRRPEIEAGFARAYESGNEAELKDQIRNAAIQTENVDTKNQVQGRMATIASLKDTVDMLNEMKAKGVPTNIISGTVEDVARKLGTSTNPEYVVLGNRLAGTLINYRRAATGVAFGEKEGAEYAKMFPNYRNTLPVNEALIKGLMREMKTYDDVYWEGKLGKEGKKFIFGEDAPAGGGPQGETPEARLKRLLGGG